MDISKLIHNPKKVHETLLRNKDHQIVTKTGCAIYFPTDYASKGLASLGEVVSVVGIFMMVVDGNHYAVSLVPALFKTLPVSIDTETIWDREYYKLTYSPGNVVMEDCRLVPIKKFSGIITDYFIDYGKTPEFVTYDKLSIILAKCRKYCNITLANPIARDIIVAGLSRDKKDPRTLYRLKIKSIVDARKAPLYIPMRDIALNTTSNFARINGNEMIRGIKETLLADATTPAPLEQLYIK